MLVTPDDRDELATAIARLMHDRRLGQQLASAGRQWVLERFNLRDCLEPLIGRYRERLGMDSVPARVPPERARDSPPTAAIRKDSAQEVQT